MIQVNGKKTKRLSDSDFAFMAKVILLTTSYPEFEAELVSLIPEGEKAPPIEAARELVDKWSQWLMLTGKEAWAV